MRFIVLLLAALVILGLLRGQDAPKGVIEGTVVDEVSGEPVRRAAVVLTFYARGRQPESLLATSGADESVGSTAALAVPVHELIEPDTALTDAIEIMIEQATLAFHHWLGG